jgi:hypothetical protein
MMAVPGLATQASAAAAAAYQAFDRASLIDVQGSDKPLLPFSSPQLDALVAIHVSFHRRMLQQRSVKRTELLQRLTIASLGYYYFPARNRVTLATT